MASLEKHESGGRITWQKKAEMAAFTPFFLQLLSLCLSTCLDSGHPPSSNQSSLSSPPLASCRFFLMVLACSCHTLQDPEQSSKHYRHPSSAHAYIPSNSIRCSYLDYSFLQPQRVHLFFSRLSVNNFLTAHDSH